MLRCYYTKLGLPDDDAKKRGAGDQDNDKDDGFPEDDHLYHVLNPRQYPLVVDPIIGNTRLTKMLMDRGSNLNILYANTLELLELDRLQLRGDATPFHGIVPGKRTQPLGRIDLIFMVVPNYTYLKLKMLGPNGAIMIESTYEHAYDYDVECIEYAEALMEAETLIANLDRLGGEAPDSKHRARMFEPTEAITLVPVDPTCPDNRVLRISSTLDIK
ncbi:uncharacterized protein [Miscanthus floridulus]|uniref:uncharacterized protein n=1 Tax=Miscanthus floridulus TaxID=154761 RepID=UPI00345B380F